MKIIFLDIDGVLNCENAYHEDECKYVGDLVSHQAFYSKSKKLLNELIANTQAKIVISSTWRFSGIEWMRKVWEEEQMNGEIIDITPHLRYLDKFKGSVERGSEIKYWLEDKGFYNINWSEEEQQKDIDKSGIENYIIIDDDSDMLYNQRNHFVHVLPSPRNKEGFNQKYYEEALSKLSKSVIELNYLTPSNKQKC